LPSLKIEATYFFSFVRLLTALAVTVVSIAITVVVVVVVFFFGVVVAVVAVVEVSFFLTCFCSNVGGGYS
jgi:hypothetical protein